MTEFEVSTDNIKTIEDAVNTALTIEQQGCKFYLEKARTSTDIAAKDLFKYLAAEESRHIEFLNDFLKIGHLSGFNETVPPDFTNSFTSEFTQKKPGELDVLMSALRFEQKNENFYKKLAAWTHNSKQREFFDMMASFEHGHVELIDGFIDAVTQFRMET
jgi:rubrerythrin